MSVRKRAMAAFIRWLAIILAVIAILSCLVLLSQDPARRCDTLGKYKYNNLALPAPPEWDETAYPYAYIYYVGETPTLCTLVLVPAEAEIVYEDGTSAILFSTPYYKSYSARTVDEQWADDGITETSGSIYLFKPMVDYPMAYTVVQWTNFDVLTKDGSLLFPGSDPVLIEEGFDLKSWLTGFTLGLAGKPLPFVPVQKEPIAYLYNGVELPPLPDWDKTAYPYAIIAEGYLGSGYALWVCSEVIIAYENWMDSGRTMLRFNGVTTYYKSWKVEGTDGWEEYISGDLTDGAGAAGNLTNNPVLWVSFDMHNQENALYLAASEPVPVYE